MRKKINALFVILAMTSVTYGMVLRYSPEQVVVSALPETLLPQEVTLPQDSFDNSEEDLLNLDMIGVEPD